MDKTQSRLRRARQTRIKIAELQVARLAVHRTNTHIYAQVFSPCGTKVLASASTLEAEVRAQLADQSGKGGNVAAATLIGKRIAEKAKDRKSTRLNSSHSQISYAVFCLKK